MIKTGGWKLMGVNAQLLGTDSAQEAALWAWIEERAPPVAEHAHAASLLHRPILRPLSSEQTRKGRYVSRAATERLLKGPLQTTLRMVVSGLPYPLDAWWVALRTGGKDPILEPGQVTSSGTRSSAPRPKASGWAS